MTIESLKISSTASNMANGLTDQNQKGNLEGRTISSLGPIDQNMDMDRASNRQGEGLLACSAFTVCCVGSVLMLLAPLCCGPRRIR